MDALAMLREDHRKVKDLFRQFEEAGDKATKQAAADTALVELNIHAILEEEIFYPAVRREGNGTGDLVRRAEQEHHTAEQLMDELMKMEAGNADFNAKFHVLIENVKKHIEEEEAEMLPIAAEVGMARLERLGEQMAERRQSLMKGPSRRTTSRTGARRTSGTRTRATGTARKTTSGTRSKTTSGTRRTTASRSRTTTSGTRGTTTSGTRRKTTAGTRTRAASPRSTGSTRSSASRAKATSRRTVKQAGSRSRTTKTRSNTSGRRSGSQSGR